MQASFWCLPAALPAPLQQQGHPLPAKLSIAERPLAVVNPTWLVLSWGEHQSGLLRFWMQWWVPESGEAGSCDWPSGWDRQKGKVLGPHSGTEWGSPRVLPRHLLWRLEGTGALAQMVHIKSCPTSAGPALLGFLQEPAVLPSCNPGQPCSPRAPTNWLFTSYPSPGIGLCRAPMGPDTSSISDRPTSV